MLGVSFPQSSSSLGPLDDLKVTRHVESVHIVRDAVASGESGLQNRVTAIFDLNKYELVGCTHRDHVPKGGASWAH